VLLAGLALGGFGTASCGGDRVAGGKHTTATDHASTPGSGPMSSTDGQPNGSVSSSTSSSVTDGGEPGNVEYFIQQLHQGNCQVVADKSEQVIEDSQDAATIADARLAHALAIGCLGETASAAQEIADVRDSTDLLSPASKLILARVDSLGTPASKADLGKLLVKTTTTGATTGATTTGTTDTTNATTTSG